MPRSSLGTKRARNSERKAQQPQHLTQSLAGGELPQLHDRIAIRAFQMYERRGKQNGRDLEDWFRAEQEVLSERMDPTSVSHIPERA